MRIVLGGRRWRGKFSGGSLGAVLEGIRATVTRLAARAERREERRERRAEGTREEKNMGEKEEIEMEEKGGEGGE